MTMTMTKKDRADSIRREIVDIERVEVHVETNQGTYSGADAVRKCGTGDPAYANREVYETVGGSVRTTGPSEDCAPGYMRDCGRSRLSALRRRVAALRAALRNL